MYAVLETGGKQYRVQVGDRFRVERLEGGVGDQVVLDKVLMVGGDGGVKFGTPYVSGASVKAEILAQARDKHTSSSRASRSTMVRERRASRC